MEINVKSKFLKVSSRKVRPVLWNLRGQNPEQVRVKLLFTNKKGALLVAQLLKSAVAVAKENDLDTNKLYIKTITCNEGPRLKRRQIKARGRADAIQKRMSHLNLIISDNQIKEQETSNKEQEVKESKESE